MTEPDTAVIQLKPFEESQCPTASPATCAVTIQGYYTHSSIVHAAEHATDTAQFNPTLSSPLITFPSNPCAIYLLFIFLHLSITVHVTPFDVHAPIHHSYTLFHSTSQLPLLSGCNLPVDTTLLSVCVSVCLCVCLSVCLSVSLSVCAGNTFRASYLMSWWCNYTCRPFRNKIGFSGHFPAVSLFCCVLAWVQGGKEKTSGINRLL